MIKSITWRDGLWKDRRFEGGLEMLFIQNLNLFCLKLIFLVILYYFV
jgi:hypothetical protein